MVMRAVAYHSKRDARVDSVPDPTIEEPTDAIVRVTSSGIRGSDLHLYEVLGAFMDEGDILGHEPMGIVEAVGSDAKQIKAGDRVVIPFNISYGRCFMCDQQLYSQCGSTQVRDQGKEASLFGYTKRYDRFPGGQGADRMSAVLPDPGVDRPRVTTRDHPHDRCVARRRGAEPE
jgi:threonine dehydrogenase-like Zn-dependent dehydrogenase